MTVQTVRYVRPSIALTVPTVTPLTVPTVTHRIIYKPIVTVLVPITVHKMRPVSTVVPQRSVLTVPPHRSVTTATVTVLATASGLMTH